VLVGRRFRWRDYAAMLPERWTPIVPEDAGEAIRAFWERHDIAEAVSPR